MQAELRDPEHEIESFIREYGERAFQFAYRLVGNAEEAKELVQESFVRMYGHWSSFDPDRSLSGWYFRILRNVFLDGLRRYDRRHAISLDRSVAGGENGESYAEALGDGAESSMDALSRDEKAREVRDVLESLSYEHKTILALVDMDGASYLDVGRVMDIPLGTVRSRVARARKAFRKSFIEARRAGA